MIAGRQKGSIVKRMKVDSKIKSKMTRKFENDSPMRVVFELKPVKT